MDIEVLVVKVEGSVIESQLVYNVRGIKFDVDSVKKTIDMKKVENEDLCCMSNE